MNQYPLHVHQLVHSPYAYTLTVTAHAQKPALNFNCIDLLFAKEQTTVKHMNLNWLIY